MMKRFFDYILSFRIRIKILPALYMSIPLVKASTGRRFRNVEAGLAAGQKVSVGVDNATATAKFEVKGEGATSATIALMVTDSGGVIHLRAYDDGALDVRPAANLRTLFTSGGNLSFVDDGGIIRNVQIIGNKITWSYTKWAMDNVGLNSNDASNAVFWDFTQQYANTAGTTEIKVWYARPTWNNTAAASGDVSFIDYNPTVNSILGTHYALKLRSGVVIIGGATADASAKLQVDSTTQGFLPPRMTTAQRDAIGAPAVGLVIYNTTTNKLNVYTGSWEAVTSS